MNLLTEVFLMNPYFSNNQPHPGYTLPCNPRNKRQRRNEQPSQQLRDYGPYPFAIDIEKATKANTNFRTALWTGPHLQLTLMSIQPGEDIGLEQHNNLDQFLRLEQGRGMVMMGDNPNSPSFQQVVTDGDAFIIPAGTWHNLTNIGNVPIRLYSIYAPIQHPYGTVHVTKEDAEAAEKQR